MHSTNKAFERYFQIESDDLRSIHRDAGKAGKDLAKDFRPSQKANILKFKE